MTAQWEATVPGSPSVAVAAADALAEHPDIARLSSALQAPQAAVRARLNAVVLDLLLLGVASQLLVSSLGASKSPSERGLIFLIVEFGYFFVCELAYGRTLGKRIFHVRVVTASGAPATARQIALRNALRVLDALPFLYASGLISMIRTGPSRRQRLGDVAAGTTVLLDAAGKPLRTPKWMLPTLTLLATVLSLAIIIPALASGRAGGAGQAPVEGVWTATATTTSSVGSGGAATTSAQWTIAKSCPAAGPCHFSLTFEAKGQPTVSAPLIAGSRSWLAVFPVFSYPCGEEAGQPIYARRRSIIGLRFANNGLYAEGEERALSQSAQCGDAALARRWTASFVRPG
jgi:uncharacterized RDD family membrane protein YckC